MQLQQQIVTTALNITVFADESRNRRCPLTGELWDYFIIGFVQTQNIDNLLNEISCVRYNQGEIRERYIVDKSSKYFAPNNRILHFSELDDADKKFLSERSTDWFLSPNNLQLKTVIYGINRSIIEDSFFGEDVYMGVYNRFFRSALLYGIKQFYGSNEKIIISKIYHEIGEQKHSGVFRKHIFKALQNDFAFAEHNIRFIEKDHEVEPCANFIQILDLILGAVTFAFHCKKGPAVTKAEAYKNLIVDKYSEILPRAVNEPKNKNSNTKHYNKFIVRSFPEKSIKQFEYNGSVYDLRSGFYAKRPIPYFDNTDQLSLFG